MLVGFENLLGLKVIAFGIARDVAFAPDDPKPVGNQFNFLNFLELSSGYLFKNLIQASPALLGYRALYRYSFPFDIDRSASCNSPDPSCRPRWKWRAPDTFFPIGISGAQPRGAFSPGLSAR